MVPGGPWWLEPVKLTGQCYQSNLSLNGILKPRFWTVLEQQDGELKAWINRERFPTYSRIDSYSLYAMGESGNVSSVCTGSGEQQKHLSPDLPPAGIQAFLLDFTSIQSSRFLLTPPLTCR